MAVARASRRFRGASPEARASTVSAVEASDSPLELTGRAYGDGLLTQARGRLPQRMVSGTRTLPGAAATRTRIQYGPGVS